MKTLRFKTNLRCNNCVAKVQNQLDADARIAAWTVDLKSPDRVLSVDSEDEKAAEVVKHILAQVGYQAVEIA